MAKFRVGDRVVKNPETWVSSEFDDWGAGEGVGVIVKCEYPLDDLGRVDVEWSNGRCTSHVDELLPAPKED